LPEAGRTRSLAGNLSLSQHPNGGADEDLCLSCGLCCDGTIFADVKLQSGDDGARLQLLGLPIVDSGAGRSGSTQSLTGAPLPPGSYEFQQPCAKFNSCRCRIYADRPKHCRDFECLLLKRVKAGQTGKATALGIIRTARQKADRVRRLLRELGDVDEELSLSKRFRRATKRTEARDWDDETADLYGQLTLAVHDFNFLVSKTFYPGNT